MSELKFICPACGQHMQCEKAYMGDKTTCPSCNAELIVPFSHKPVEYKTQLPTAELIFDPAKPLQPNCTIEQTPSKEFSTPLSPSNKPAAHPLVSAPTCICPVCHSELRLPQLTVVPENCMPPTAELAHNPTSETQESSALNSALPPISSPVPEREQHIAAARESHPISPYPAMKPRLAYVLSGGESVVPKKNNPPNGKEPREGKESSSTDSFAE